MKMSDENLQKLIDTLNEKLSRNTSMVQQLENEFNNDDLEHKSEIYNELTCKLEECNQDINGQYQMDTKCSLRAQRNLVIEEINKLVAMLNDTRVLEVSDLIEAFQSIVKASTGILFKIESAKTFAGQIDKRLDVYSIVEAIRLKYRQKH
jgi:hypothetical protein